MAISRFVVKLASLLPRRLVAMTEKGHVIGSPQRWVILAGLENAERKLASYLHGGVNSEILISLRPTMLCRFGMYSGKGARGLSCDVEPRFNGSRCLLANGSSKYDPTRLPRRAL